MDRAPAVAGVFYPGDEAGLRATVARLIGPSPSTESAIAVVAPHAGYVYSGAIAGEVFRRVRVPETAIVICPNHTGAGPSASLYESGTWHIPGHDVPIDEPLAAELAASGRLTADPLAHLHEHGVEVQVPFLVHRNPRVRIVPIVLGSLPYEECVRIGETLAQVIEASGREVLIVASTDMSHYIPADVAKAMDRLALDRVEALDPDGLYHTVRERGISMCGFIPTTVALIAARKLGATEAHLVRYGNSGDASGDYDRVVAYAGLVIR